MPTITDDAICLRRWDFSETSQTVSLLTREHGILRGLAKGAKRPRGGFSGGLDLLTRGQIVAIIKPGRDLSTLTGWHLEHRYAALRTSLAANRVGWFMADLVHHLLTLHDPHPAAFDALCVALSALDDGDDADRVLLAFQWALLAETGYRPVLDRDAQTNHPLPTDTPTLAFSASAGGVVTDTGEPGRWRVRRETIELLRRVANGAELSDAPAETTDRANRLLAYYVREIIGAEPNAMRWAFDDSNR